MDFSRLVARHFQLSPLETPETPVEQDQIPPLVTPVEDAPLSEEPPKKRWLPARLTRLADLDDEDPEEGYPAPH